MSDKKSLPFAILKILTEYTDDNHILRSTEIKKILEQDYGLKLERRTLYSNVQLLRRFGYRIETYRENGIGYYLKEHQFSREEAYLLCDDILRHDIIQPDEKSILINKVLSTLSKYQSGEYVVNLAESNGEMPI